MLGSLSLLGQCNNGSAIKPLYLHLFKVNLFRTIFLVRSNCLMITCTQIMPMYKEYNCMSLFFSPQISST